MTETPFGGKPARGATARRIILAIGGGLALVAIASVAVERGLAPGWLVGPAPQKTAAAKSGTFSPPDPSTIPDDAFGASVKRGMTIFTNTGTAAGQYVGNALSCSNCHLDAGRQAFAAPMWAAWVTYPQYRSKNKSINTMEDRVKGCFTYSMNGQDSPSGGPPPAGSDVYRDLDSYFFWLATGLATNEKPKGIGFGSIAAPPEPFDRSRGEKVFAENCAVCHGADGQGQKDLNGRVIFPPLWGAHSYNWGAGMASVKSAAEFVQHNMPLSEPGRLSVQQAWDVAAWIDSQERPKDPRQTGSVEAAMKAHHGGANDFYGKTVDGHLLGTGTPPEASRTGN